MQNLCFFVLSALTLSLLLVEMGHMYDLDCTWRNETPRCLLPQTCNCSMPPEDPNGYDLYTYNATNHSCVLVKAMNTSCNVFDSKTQCEYFCADGEDYSYEETSVSNDEIEEPGNGLE
ncbi:uncharacterized protein LOC119464942 [Dermacentor silvarum]|uniref:uncharacterized protein LOC119464942 n=1 Tax=Dermacentor silvarum TaxID=543639 RepID=UPI0018982CF5|nr:uncharacterized protein LOC119464942 [Dermacentor silvarum]